MVALAAAVAASIALVGPAPGTGAAAAASAVPAMPTAMPTAQVPAPPIAAQTATTPPSTAQMIDGQVTVSVDSLAPEVIAAGQDFVQGQYSKGQNYLVWAVIQAITFAAGVFIILQGVRLILAEIVPAFTGFSQKLVPNARPALDCPIVFPYAPNAVLVGFLASFAGGLVGLFILGKLNWVLILPGVVPHFFCGATAGVFGNAVGGRLGAVVGAFLHGILITFLPVWLLPVLGDLGFANTTFSDADFGVVGIALGWLGSHAGRFAITALVIGIVAALVAYNYAVPVKAKVADKAKG